MNNLEKASMLTEFYIFRMKLSNGKTRLFIFKLEYFKNAIFNYRNFLEYYVKNIMILKLTLAETPERLMNSFYHKFSMHRAALGFISMHNSDGQLVSDYDAKFTRSRVRYLG